MINHTSKNKISSTTPILFAQTREHAEVEIDALNQIKSIDPLSICLIASGGDTLCDILTNKSELKSGSIDIVDASINQINLTKLKLALIQKFDGDFCVNFLTNGFKNINPICLQENMQENIEITNAQDSKFYCCQLLNELLDAELLNKECFEYWLTNISYLIAGVNQMGRFEILFRILKISSIEICFDHKYLTDTFGENATKYSMEKSFIEHFKDVFEKYKTLYPDPTTNYFYYQILYDCYPVAGDRPLYLSSEKPITTNFTVNYHIDHMQNHLTKQPDEKYDLLHLSNITDWLSPDILCGLMDDVGRVVKKNGKVTMRRLNSDTNLKKFLTTNYEYCGKYKYDIAESFDKSLFYSEVLVLTKK